MTKTKVLSICAIGVNRSKYIANYLRKKGYSTRYGGIKDEAIKPLDFKHVEWADVIIFAREKHKEYFEDKYGRPYSGKKIYVLEVRDSGKDVPKELDYLHNLPRDEFNKKWTHPNLRKKLKEKNFA